MCVGSEGFTQGLDHGGPHSSFSNGVPSTRIAERMLPEPEEHAACHEACISPMLSIRDATPLIRVLAPLSVRNEQTLICGKEIAQRPA